MELDRSFKFRVTLILYPEKPADFGKSGEQVISDFGARNNFRNMME
jgi:hypothetical protein